MREITAHKVKGVDDRLSIVVMDEPGSGGASHLYDIIRGQLGEDYIPHVLGRIQFQNGPIHEEGVNGVTHETLLAIVIDRLIYFQMGPYANEYNHQALLSLENALAMLKKRTAERLSRSVEGTHTV